MKGFDDGLSVYGGNYWKNTYFLVVECTTSEMVHNLEKVVDYVQEIIRTGASRTFVVSVDSPQDEKEKEVCKFDIDGDGADSVLTINKVKRSVDE